ncbi:MAG TPA: redoxin domain-containing protein [Terriglobales bacterium]|jgi:peroxiredoxin (alkyl hydroperoxide reductase subunit C)
MDAVGIKPLIPEIGDVAPDFDLPALIGGVKRRFHLAEQRGQKHIVLAFYPFNWEPISGRQLVEYQVERERFLSHDAALVTICVDSIMNTTTWEREIGPFDFVLCSDFWPHGEVCSRYGVLNEQGTNAGASRRAVFVVSKEGTIAFRRLYDASDLPEWREPLEVLRELSP